MTFSKDSKILVCIAYWNYDNQQKKDERFHILKQCIQQYQLFQNAHVVVHTQNAKAIIDLKSLGVEPVVSNHLSHPYMLTYEHRKIFRERLHE
jgi:hypothetical protein